MEARLPGRIDGIVRMYGIGIAKTVAQRRPTFGKRANVLELAGVFGAVHVRTRLKAGFDGRVRFGEGPGPSGKDRMDDILNPYPRGVRQGRAW